MPVVSYQPRSKYKAFSTDARALHHALFENESLRSENDGAIEKLCTACLDIPFDAIFGKSSSESQPNAQGICLFADLKRNRFCRFCRFLHHVCTLALPWESLQALEDCNAVLHIERESEAWHYFITEDSLGEWVSPNACLDIKEMPGLLSVPYFFPWVIWRQDDAGKKPPLNLRWRALSDPLFDKFDVEPVKMWISSCQASHKRICESQHRSNSSSEQSAEHFQTYFIDVHTRDVVQANLQSEYVALSYVWGNPNEGTRDYPISWEPSLPEKVSQTVEDAMQVVRQLGKKFLWVDAYCIDQSSAWNKEYQIRQMDIIYEKAYLTIVALSGESADAGLPGISVPFESMPQPQVKLAHNTLTATRLPEFWLTINESPWNGRAWTMQETALSKRCLCFTKDNVFMMCRQATFHAILESTPSAKFTRCYRELFDGKFPFHMDYTQEWSMTTFHSIITTYTKRSLTHESDALAAVTGLFNRISRFTHVEFLFGHPKRGFIHSLLWAPQGDTRPTRRIGFPTWSWSGWKCEVYMPYWLERLPRDHVHHVRNLYTLEIAEAYDYESHLVQEADIATVSWPSEEKSQALKIYTSIIMLEVKRVAKDGELFVVDEESDQESDAVGDLWCILDENGEKITHCISSIRLGGFGCCFRLESSLSGELAQASNAVEFLLLTHWREKKENEEDISKDAKDNVEVGDSIFAMLILRNNNGTARRLAIVSIPASIWEASSPKNVMVELV